MNGWGCRQRCLAGLESSWCSPLGCCGMRSRLPASCSWIRCVVCSFHQPGACPHMPFLYHTDSGWPCIHSLSMLMHQVVLSLHRKACATASLGLRHNKAESQDTLYWALQEGNVIKGHGRPEATAFWIHSRLHHLRPGTGAVFHTHQPEITALACLDGNFE